MPELPEVETVRRGLEPVLKGRRIVKVTARRRDLRRPLPNDFARRVKGRRVIAVGRRAKFLVVTLDGGETLIVHLGMSGRIKIFKKNPPAPEAHDHVLFETDKGVFIYYCDPRRFGLMALTRSEDLDGHPFFRGLGPEPLERGFNGSSLAVRLKGRKTSIKAALMDQRVVAGLGNIYVSESLFRAGISPRRKASTVQGERAVKLARAIKEVLKKAIRAGGSTLRDHRLPSGELGYFQHQFAVYGRTGEKCPGCTCDVRKTGGIRQITQGGRSTFYCATRQR
ncbi:MAG: bifunctional DNA-formamidopyrimidine glycosylase/DNA-(apurinic or apyrimidinic site) lyase [Rhodospirillales bacterium]|nr:bifunctional DNA-formamidopyrimidine glycosylase/DNA-(apurinic or apyrimidinic site) lyase [Rhodospirillales bacterium]